MFRSAAFLASLAALAAGVLLLWLAGSLAGGLPAGGSLYMALAVISRARSAAA